MVAMAFMVGRLLGVVGSGEGIVREHEEEPEEADVGEIEPGEAAAALAAGVEFGVHGEVCFVVLLV